MMPHQRTTHHVSSYRCFGVPILLPILLFVSLAILLRSTMSNPNPEVSQEPLSDSSSSINTQPPKVHFRFHAPAQYFLPSLPTTDPTTYNPTTTNFGLIHQSYPLDSPSSSPSQNRTDWLRFAHHLRILNLESPPSTRHHVLFLSRHGQGYHNLAESYYGREAWDCYFSELDGDPEPNSNITWSDADLSRLGRRQAEEQREFWRDQYARQRMPEPSSYWVSPMERACRTAQITHGFGLQDSGDKDERVITVKEMLRETNGIHTCDRRSPRSRIAKMFPSYTIEAGFTENDELWDPVYRETFEAHTYRAKVALDQILGASLSGKEKEKEKGKEETEYISITAHSGMISAVLAAVGHRPFQLQVGSALAVYLVSERVEGKRPEESFEKGRTKQECVEDPFKAGLPGYKSLREYVDAVEGDVREGDVDEARAKGLEDVG